MIKKKIEKIIANDNRRCSWFEEDLDSLSNNLLANYFVERIKKSNGKIEDIIINDFLKKYYPTRNKIHNLDETIILLSSVDERIVEISKDKKKVIIPEASIETIMAIDSYLGIIKDKRSLDLIEKAESKDDLKALILIDRIYSNNYNVDIIIDKRKSIQKNAIMLAKYINELSQFTKSSSRLKQLHKKAKDIAGSSSFTLKSIQYMKEASDSLAGCSQEYKTITKNPEMVKQIEEARERYSGLKGCLDSWSVKLRECLEDELNSIDISPLYISNQTSRLNELKQKYESAGMKSQGLDQKLSQLSVIEDKINMRLHTSYRKNPKLLYRFRKKLAYAAAGLIFLVSAGVYTVTKPEAHIGHSRMTTTIIDNKLISSDMKQDNNIKEYVGETKERYESRFADIKQMFTKAGTIEEYESTQKQLDNLKAEIKGFMNSEIYKRYNGGKHD